MPTTPCGALAFYFFLLFRQPTFLSDDLDSFVALYSTALSYYLPYRRDTVTVPGRGWAVVHIVADNAELGMYVPGQR
jgi:hypothetical protein